MAAPKVNEKLLQDLEEMGFPRARATRALYYSGNTSLEDAINWTIDHENDPDIDEMPLVDIDIEIESSESFPLTKEMRIKVQKLTREQELKRKEDEKKILEKEREKERIQAGKKLLEANQRAEENERQRNLSLRKAEKEEDERARERVLQKLEQDKGHVQKIKFCQWCGGTTKYDIPEGEERLRAICTICGKIAYQNPKMVVGCLIEHDNKVLLCKRKIEPSYGLWTLPGGYLEIGESTMEGAIRETREEANADVEVISPFAQLDIPLIGQTNIIFLAKLKNPHFSPGPESSECQFFSLDDIPFSSLSFSSMVVTLSLYVEDIKAGKPRFHYGTINKRPGTSPSDIHAFTLEHHMLL